MRASEKKKKARAALPDVSERKDPDKTANLRTERKGLKFFLGLAAPYPSRQPTFVPVDRRHRNFLPAPTSPTRIFENRSELEGIR